MTIAAGAAIRLFRLTFVTLWSDEYHTILTMRVPWPQLLTGHYVGDFNPPLYFVLLRLWQAVAGPTEFSWRMFSVFFGILSLGLVSRLAAETLGSRARLPAALIFAFHPIFIYYATEIRGYSLMLFLALLAWLSYFRYWQTRRPVWLAALILSMCLSPYVHHFGILVPLTVGLFWMIDTLSTSGGPRWAVAGALLLAAATYVPDAWFVLRNQIGAAPAAQAAELPNLPFLIWGLWQLPPALTTAGQVLLSIALLVGVGVLLRLRGPASARYGFTAVIVIATLGVLSLYWRGVPFTPRYLVHIDALTVLLLAALLVPRGRLLNILGGAAVATYLVAGTSLTLQRPNYFPDWNRVAAIVRENSLGQEPVVILGFDAAPVEYFLGRPVLTSFQFLDEVAANARPSYLLIDSHYAGKLPQLASAEILYVDQVWDYRILRFRSNQTH